MPRLQPSRASVGAAAYQYAIASRYHGADVNCRKRPGVRLAPLISMSASW